MPTPPTRAAADGVRRAAGTLAVLVAAGVLLQSVLAGGFLSAVYGGSELAGARTLHEVGANVTFGLLAVEGLLVLATPLRRDRQHLVSGLVLAGLLTAVIGLGYVGGGAVGLHVPFGVTAFGVALWHALAANGRQLVRTDQR